MTIGKTSFEEQQLLENYQAIIEELIRAKPSAAKGRYLRSIVLASTMGPGVKVDPSRTKDLIEEEAAPRGIAAATRRFSRDPRPPARRVSPGQEEH